jgi:hypothetical protein
MTEAMGFSFVTKRNHNHLLYDMAMIGYDMDPHHLYQSIQEHSAYLISSMLPLALLCVIRNNAEDDYRHAC